MKPLFEICEGWENCDNEDLRSLFERKIIEGKKFKLPKEKELEKLKKICRNCGHSLKIEKKECPMCERKDLITIFPSDIEDASITIYRYKCKNCSRHLYSYKEL